MYEQKFLDEYIEENPARDSDMLVEELVMLDISENIGIDDDAAIDDEFVKMYDARMDGEESK